MAGNPDETGKKSPGEGGEGESGWQFEPSASASSPDWGTKNYEYDRNAKKWKEDKSEKKMSVQASTGPLYEKSGDAAIYSTKEGADDKTFASLGHGEASIKTLELDYDFTDGKAALTVLDAKAKGSVVHGEAANIEDKIADFVNGMLGRSRPKTGMAGGASMGFGPFAARVGDFTGHGTPLSPGIGSPNVFIGGRPAWRTLVDFHACPMIYPPPHVGGVVMKGAYNVLINFQMACRMGDIVVEIPGGPNPIASGCPSVMIGEMGSGAGGAAAGKPHDWLDIDAEGNLLTAEAEANLGIEYKDGSLDATAKAGAMAAVAEGEVEGKFRIPIPFTDYSFTVGGTAGGSVASIGAEAEASMKINRKDPKTGKTKLFDSKVGASVAAGLGLKLDFSLGIEED